MNDKGINQRLKRMSTSIDTKTQVGLSKGFNKIIETLNALVDSVLSTGESSKKGARQSGHIGQLRQKRLGKKKYTLEIMTDTGWKEAYIEVEVSGTKYKGKLLFE